MKTLIPAALEHVSPISSLLVREYKKLNEQLGYDFYKTDFDLFVRITESRIRSQDGEFKFFVAVDEDWALLGFISLLQKKRWEVLMVVSKNDEDLEVLLPKMLEFWISYLKDTGSESVVFEVSPHEKTYQEVLKALWAKNFSSKFIL